VPTADMTSNAPGSGTKAPRKRSATRKPSLARRRPAKKADPIAEVGLGRSVTASSARRESSRQVEQLGVIALALVCSVIGFAVHAFWFGSIVLMAMLFGLTAAELRTARGRGIISEVVSEARIVTQEITGGEGSDPDPPTAGEG
jgi:hypothetical protein